MAENLGFFARFARCSWPQIRAHVRGLSTSAPKGCAANRPDGESAEPFSGKPTSVSARFRRDVPALAVLARSAGQRDLEVQSVDVPRSAGRRWRGSRRCTASAGCRTSCDRDGRPGCRDRARTRDTAPCGVRTAPMPGPFAVVDPLAYCPSASRHDCQLPSSRRRLVVGERSEELRLCKRCDPEAAGDRKSCNQLPFRAAPRPSALPSARTVCKSSAAAMAEVTDCASFSWRYTRSRDARADRRRSARSSAAADGDSPGRQPRSPRWPEHARRSACGSMRAAAPPGAEMLVERALATWTRAADGPLRASSGRRRATRRSIRVRFAPADGIYGETAPRIDRATGLDRTAEVLIAGDVAGDAVQTAHRDLPDGAARARARARAAAHRTRSTTSCTASGGPTMVSGISGRIGGGCARAKTSARSAPRASRRLISRRSERCTTADARAACVLPSCRPASARPACPALPPSCLCYDGVFMKHILTLARGGAAGAVVGLLQEGRVAEAGGGAGRGDDACRGAAAARRRRPARRPACPARHRPSSRCRRRSPTCSRASTGRRSSAGSSTTR